MLPDHPDALLTRDATAVALTAAGFPVTGSTLAAKAARGGGPAYQVFGRRPLYRWGSALAWAEGRLGQANPPNKAHPSKHLQPTT